MTPSDLETLIANSLHLHPQERQSCKIGITGGISNYNPRQSAALSLRPCRRILVPGQVNDDALIHLGTRNICTNLALLRRTHEQNPDAILVYKRHPDVKVGLQPSALSEEAQYYDIIAADHDTISSKVRGMKFGR